MGILQKFLRLPPSEKRALIGAVFWLAVTQLSIKLLPFRRVAPLLGSHMRESPRADDPKDEEIARRISWAVQAGSRHLLWKSKCLPRAMAAKAMLRRSGVASTLYLGLAKNPDERLCAHAWLRCGSLIVTGRCGFERFTTVATFAEEEL